MSEIYVNYGSDPAEMTIALMDAAGVASQISARSAVCIKPNLVVARTADGGATTHPEIVEGIIRYLQGHGVRDITIAEGSWVGDSTKHAFDVCGYTALAEKYAVRLTDTKSDRTVERRLGGSSAIVCESIAGADYLINVPVLKAHCQTGMTCCLKNLKGCIPDSEKRRYHTAGLHRPIALLNTLLKPDLHIVDGICGDLTFEEGGNPVESNRVLLGFDPVLLDSYCAGLIGYAPDEIEHLRLAREYAVGEYRDAHTEIRELNAQNKPRVPPPQSRTVQELASRIDEDGACSACYAALIFALNHSPKNRTARIKIGQGFKGRQCAGFGVGNCASGCERFVKGCPPSARDILSMLNQDGQ